MCGRISLIVVLPAVFCAAQDSRPTQFAGCCSEGLTAPRCHHARLDDRTGLRRSAGHRAGMGVETLREPPGRFEMPVDNPGTGLSAGRYALFTLGYDADSRRSAFSRSSRSRRPEPREGHRLETTAGHIQQARRRVGARVLRRGNGFSTRRSSPPPAHHSGRDQAGRQVAITCTSRSTTPSMNPTTARPPRGRRVSPCGAGRTAAQSIRSSTSTRAYRSNEIELKPSKTYAVASGRDPARRPRNLTSSSP